MSRVTKAKKRKRVPLKSRRRLGRKDRVRAKISGTEGRPRLAVFRTARHVYAQVIDDITGKTMAAASTLSKDLRESIEGKEKAGKAKEVGTAIAERCKEKGSEVVVFDRGGFPYHGRVQALADAARSAGLKF